MKNFYRRLCLTGLVAICCASASAQTTQEPATGSITNLNDALIQIADTAATRTYKEVTIYTDKGAFQGEWVKSSGDVIILKTNSEATHLASGKERVHYTVFNRNSVTGISFATLE